MARLRAPFVAIATTATVLACSASGSTPASESSSTGDAAATACDAIDFGQPCSEEGRICYDPCTSGPFYDQVCRDGRWVSAPNGFCNPPGWPSWDAEPQPDTATSAGDATVTETGDATTTDASDVADASSD